VVLLPCCARVRAVSRLPKADFSVSKNFHITERIKAQFRMDAFNLFNHPQYGNPDTGIGFNATNTVASPEFLDENACGLCGQSDRNREFQYSIRFTF